MAHWSVLSTVALRQGNKGEALRLARRSAELAGLVARDNPSFFSSEYCNRLIDLVIAYLAMRNWNGAARVLEEADRIADNLYLDDPIRFSECKISTLSGKTTVCWRQNKMREASRHADKIVEILSEVGFMPAYCAKALSILSLRLHIYLQLNDSSAVDAIKTIINVYSILRDSAEDASFHRDSALSLLAGTLNRFYGEEQGFQEFIHFLSAHPWIQGQERLGRSLYESLSNDYDGYIRAVGERLLRLSAC